MMYKTRFLLCLALVGAFALSACSSSGKKATSPTYDRLVAPAILSTDDANLGTATGLAAAAANDPVPGSVTQSSDADDPEVEVTVTGPANAPVISVFYDIANNADPLVTTQGTRTARNLWTVGESPKGTTLYERLRGKTWRGAEFYRHVEMDDIESGSPAGQLWVDVYTDYEGPDDTDYLAGGIWVFVPEDATTTAAYEFGAFADGNDPFNQTNLLAVTGEATYAGDATGLYSDQEDNVNVFFDALVELTANFGTDSTLGTIGGRIYDFTVRGADVPGNPQLTLAPATLTDSEGGFFTDATSMTWDGDTYTGKWGGQFYGNGAEDDDPPGSVAGTFGATTGTPGGDDAQTILGVYGAHRQME